MVPSKVQPNARAASKRPIRKERRLERIDNEDLRTPKWNPFLIFFNPDRQRFIQIYVKAKIVENLARREKSISAPAGRRTKQKKLNPKETMLWTIFVVILILWLLGFIGHFGGSLIHLLLVIALVILIVNLISGRRSL